MGGTRLRRVTMPPHRTTSGELRYRLDVAVAGEKGRVTNPPQVENLPHITPGNPLPRGAAGRGRGYPGSVLLDQLAGLLIPYAGTDRETVFAVAAGTDLRFHAGGAHECARHNYATVLGWWISCKLHTRMGSRNLAATALAAARAPLMVVMQGTRYITALRRMAFSSWNAGAPLVV